MFKATVQVKGERQLLDICGQTEEACRELANRIIRNGRDGTILTVVPLSGGELEKIEKIRNGY